MSRATWFLGAVLAVLLIQAPPATAQKAEAGPAGSERNVQITLTITRSGGAVVAPRVYKLIGQDGSMAKMLFGFRTPIPTMSAARDESGKPPATNFIYQNVGVSAELRVKVLGQGSVLLDGQIEISGAREGPVVGAGGERAPLIGTFQQALKVIAMEGKKLRVAEGPDPEGGTLSLDIEATVLK